MDNNSKFVEGRPFPIKAGAGAIIGLKRNSTAIKRYLDSGRVFKHINFSFTFYSSPQNSLNKQSRK